MRVVLLMNFVAPYRVPLLEALRDGVGQLRVLLSVKMEKDRHWTPEWGTLDVRVQRTVTIRRRYRDQTGFSRGLEIHIPYDTLPQLAAVRPEAVISGELGFRSLQAALYRLMRPRVALLIWATLSEHSERNWGPVRTALRRFILGRADGVLVNGESGARYIAQFGVPADRIFRLNQPVDVARFAAEPRRRPEGAGTRLLYSGMLTPRKGLLPFAETLIGWASDNPGREIEMWWLGGGELHDALSRLVLPSNLRFNFLGQCAYSALPAVYAQADLFVFPTLLDEWGLVVNEAFAAGLPVLGSVYSQAVEELVTEGETGWIFDPLVGPSLRSGLDRALSVGPAKLADMRRAARNRIAELTPDAAARRMVSAIHTVLKDRSPATVKVADLRTDAAGQPMPAHDTKGRTA